MQKFKLKQYPQPSPERVLVQMFQAWELKRWNQVLECAQLTWSRTMPNAIDWLKIWYGPAKPSNAEIVSVEYITDVFAKVHIRADFDLTFKGKGNKNYKTERKACEFTVHMICESAPRVPSKDGRWGFNPPSMLGYLHPDDESKEKSIITEKP